MEASEIAAAARATATVIEEANKVVQAFTPNQMSDAASRMLSLSWERFAIEIERRS